MTPRARVFVASWDEMLLRSRTMMLGAYFSVQPAGRFSEGVRILRDNAFDLLLLCHTLTDDEQECLTTIARQTYPPVEVLVLQTHAETDKPFADHVHNSSSGPWELVRLCSQIVGYRLKSKAHRSAKALPTSALSSTLSRKQGRKPKQGTALSER